MANKLAIRPVQLKREKFVLDGAMPLRTARFLVIFFTLLSAAVALVTTADVSSGMVVIVIGAIIGIGVESSAKPWETPQ